MIKKVKNNVSWTYIISALNEKKLLQRFMKNNYKKQVKKNLGLKKVIKRKSDKVYVKWKDYHNSFNSWIDKKDLVQMSEYFPELKSLG